MITDLFFLEPLPTRCCGTTGIGPELVSINEPVVAFFATGVADPLLLVEFEGFLISS